MHLVLYNIVKCKHLIHVLLISLNLFLLFLFRNNSVVPDDMHQQSKLIYYVLWGCSENKKHMVLNYFCRLVNVFFLRSSHTIKLKNFSVHRMISMTNFYKSTNPMNQKNKKITEISIEKNAAKNDKWESKMKTLTPHQWFLCKLCITIHQRYLSTFLWMLNSPFPWKAKNKFSFWPYLVITHKIDGRKSKMKGKQNGYLRLLMINSQLSHIAGLFTLILFSYWSKEEEICCNEQAPDCSQAICFCRCVLSASSLDDPLKFKWKTVRETFMYFGIERSYFHMNMKRCY